MKVQSSISEQSEESSDVSRVKCKVQSYLGFFCLVTLLLCHLVTLFPCHAQETTPSATKEAPSPKKNQLEKIRILKEKVATKVAELREKGKRAYFGEIVKISGTTIILATKKGDEITVMTDEETKIFRVDTGGRKKIDFEDLRAGERVVAFGILEEEKLNAKVIIAKALPVIIHGKVMGVDIEGGKITVKTPKKGEFIVDYEVATRCRIFEKGKGLVRCGLSKIEVDDRVFVIGTAAEEESRLTAQRILVLPGKALGIVGKEATPSATIAPSP